MRRAGRITLKLSLCLLVGTAVTWAVAWGCALNHGDIFTNRSLRGHSIEVHVVDDDRLIALGRAVSVTGLQRWTLRNPLTTHVTQLIAWPPPVPLEVRPRSWMLLGDDVGFTVTDLVGWPAPCLYSQGADSGAFKDPLAIAGPRGALPTRILPLGFALNTALAAGLVLGLIEGSAFMRRWRRTRASRCPSCGYDRAGFTGDAACPECGSVPQLSH
jgi:hypothetical protein